MWRKRSGKMKIVHFNDKERELNFKLKIENNSKNCSFNQTKDDDRIYHARLRIGHVVSIYKFYSAESAELSSISD